MARDKIDSKLYYEIFLPLISERDKAKGKGQTRKADLLNDTVTKIADARELYKEAISTTK